ncbi:Hypothetical protein, putative [Bodo saltans]|uniref:Uncharacterized protein n=1 Tax=Bodo saltans TaxID=75058 RepID=A0A0S4IV49_BODSA|nr:Hypothetical protein, putative [Bodo saltans]|eukprot:CUF96854.1 Hypothetical protein, putative [Bodo saltans]
MPRPTVNQLNLSVPQDVTGAVSAQQTQRTGRGTSRLSALVLSARGMLSALSTARRKHIKSPSVTPGSSHLEPPVSFEQSYVWKLLPSQRQQLCELYHRHHDLTDSFWGMYDLVHAANISVSPPALVEALVEVGVNVPRGVKSVDGAGIFLSEFQFLRVVEGIMTDSKHEHSYYENDKRLVELALHPEDEGEGMGEESCRENEMLAIDDNTKIPVSRLSQVLRQYDLGTKPHHLRPTRTDGPMSTPPPAFLVAVLQDTSTVSKKNQRKSIAPSRLDVPDHVSLDMLCSALNRATLATPDPLCDFRSANVRADASPSVSRNRGASLLGLPRVPAARLSVSQMESSTLGASFASSGPPPVADQSLELVVPLAPGAVESSRNGVSNGASPRKHSHNSSPAHRRQQHKMISSTGVTNIPLPPLKKGPGFSELTGQGLRRQDSLDYLLRTTMDSCVEVTRVFEKNLAKRQTIDTRVSQLKRNLLKRSGPLSHDDRLAETQSASDIDEEDFSESSSMGSIQRRHNLAADQKFGAFNVFVSGTYSPPRACVASSSLPPLSLPQLNASDASPAVSRDRPAASYRKPWQESSTVVDDEARRLKRLTERKAKESRKIGMQALVAEVHALSVAERRALTPTTRRMVAIARSASSLGDSSPRRASNPRASPAKPENAGAVPHHHLLSRWTTGGM